MCLRHSLYATNKRGAALLTVLVALLLISLMTLELQYTSLVERKLAYNDLNQLQAHYLAKSGIHMGILRLALYGRVQKQFGQNKNVAPYLSKVWSLPFPSFPPEASAIGKLSLQDKTEQEEALKETRISEGQFSYTISSESNKLNLNLLASTGTTAPNFRQNPTKLNEYIGFNLLHKIERLFRESDDPTGEFGNVRPEDIVYNIMDWVTPSNTGFAAGNKDSWYEQQVPPYKAKRGPFFTLDELKLVKDISPALFLKLKPLITVFSDNGRIDLDAATTRGNKTLKEIYPDFSDRDMDLIWTHFEQMGGTWGNVQNFKSYMNSNFPRFIMMYPDAVCDQVFTIGSENFLVKAQGKIKKSGSTIQKNIVVAAALSGPRGGTPLPKYTDQATCEKNFANVWVFGQCVTSPQSEAECKSSGYQVCTSTITNGPGCMAPNDLGIGPTRCYPFPAQTPGSVNFAGLKVFSWVES